MSQQQEIVSKSGGAGLRSHAPVLLGLAVSGILAGLAFRNVRLTEVARAIYGVRLGWLPVMLGVILGDLSIRSLRWKLLLRHAAPRAGVWPLLRLETVGLAVNNVTFLRLGELARAFLAGRELDIPMPTSLATIFVERALDMVTLVFLFGLAARAHAGLIPAGLSRTAFAVVAGLILALVVLALADGRLRGGFLGRKLQGYPKILAVVEEAAQGTRALQSLNTALPVLALGLGLWLMDALLYWAAGRAMSLSPALTYGHSLLVLASAAATALLPAVPGSFGTFEQGVKAFLVYLGVDGAVALGYAGFVHVINYLLTTGLGVAFMYREGLTLAHFRKLRDG